MSAATDELRRLLREGAFQSFLGLELLDVDHPGGSVTLRLPWRAEFERTPGSGQWHGGPIAALIDIAGDFALVASLGRGLPTISLRVDYLRPATGAALIATGRTLRAGRSVGFVDVDVRDAPGRLVAVGRGNYSTLQPASA